MKKTMIFIVTAAISLSLLLSAGCRNTDSSQNNAPPQTEKPVMSPEIYDVDEPASEIAPTAAVTAIPTPHISETPVTEETPVATETPAVTETYAATQTPTICPTRPPIADNNIYPTRTPVEKPLIYLYPEEETEVYVTLDYKGSLTCTYPEYNDGWNVIAKPDGTLTEVSTGKEYSYLFWEGIDGTQYDMSKGFVVKGEDPAEFLQETLAKIGLTPKEYNEFIVYWLPKMQDNPYNLITFQGEDYTDTAKLTVSPTPDSLLRVFMVYTPLTEPVEIEAPEIEAFERKGFTVIEWGGTEI